MNQPKSYSMISHNRRKHQRQLNALCRRWNNNIKNDTLWRGRFVVEQVSTRMWWFDDKSGGIMQCVLRFRDKKTGKTQLWYTNALEAFSQMYFHFNAFIVDYCKVWETENPYKETQSWR